MSQKNVAFKSAVVNTLYDNYAKLIFCDAMRLLMEKNLLSTQEKVLLAQAMELAKTGGFFRKSYLIYLSNGILWEVENKHPQRIPQIKQQLFLEVSLRLLDHGKSQVEFSSTDDRLFSLSLNQHIPATFDLIRKNAENYEFLVDEAIQFSTKKNTDCAIASDIDFLVADRNPFNINNDHPDQAFVAYELKGIQKEEWVRQFRSAYALIQEKTPEVHEEIYRFLDAIVPHGYEKNKQLSSSYSKSPGILYLSYTDDDIKQAEAIIHEVNHTIFNVISWKYKLFENDMELKYYSAYRPDARHIRGCFLGLHAFVAVQNFYKVLCEQDLEYIEIFLTFYLKNAKTISVLEKHMVCTQQGRMLLDDIKAKFEDDVEFYAQVQQRFPDISKRVDQEVENHLVLARQRNAVLLD